VRSRSPWSERFSTADVERRRAGLLVTDKQTLPTSFRATRNQRLRKIIGAEMHASTEPWNQTGNRHGCSASSNTKQKTRKRGWDCERRVVAKAEHIIWKENPRFNACSVAETRSRGLEHQYRHFVPEWPDLIAVGDEQCGCPIRRPTRVSRCGSMQLHSRFRPHSRTAILEDCPQPEGAARYQRVSGDVWDHYVNACQPVAAEYSVEHVPEFLG
jgi:hypothetical protein